MNCKPCTNRADSEGACARTCGDPACTCQHRGAQTGNTTTSNPKD